MVNLRFTCSNCKNNIKSTTQSKDTKKIRYHTTICWMYSSKISKLFLFVFICLGDTFFFFNFAIAKTENLLKPIKLTVWID